MGADSDSRIIQRFCISLFLNESSIRYAWRRLRWPDHPGIVLLRLAATRDISANTISAAFPIMFASTLRPAS